LVFFFLVLQMLSLQIVAVLLISYVFFLFTGAQATGGGVIKILQLTVITYVVVGTTNGHVYSA